MNKSTINVTLTRFFQSTKMANKATKKVEVEELKAVFFFGFLFFNHFFVVFFFSNNVFKLVER